MRVETMSDIQRLAVYLATLNDELKNRYLSSFPPALYALVNLELSSLGHIDPTLKNAVIDYLKRNTVDPVRKSQPQSPEAHTSRSPISRMVGIFSVMSPIFAVVMTLAGLAFFGWVVLDENSDAELKKCAVGIMGVIIGLWIRLPLFMMSKKRLCSSCQQEIYA